MGQGMKERREGQAHPRGSYLVFSLLVERDRMFFFLCSYPLFILFVSFICRIMGRRSPTRIDYFDLGQDKVMKNPAAVRESSGKPLPWPFGPVN